MSNQNASPQGELSYSLLRRISPICDQFEAVFQAGDFPSVEFYLVKVDDTDRKALLFELLKLDQEYRLALGSPIPTSNYLSRFPSESDYIRDMFEQAATLHTGALGTVLIHQGPPIENALPKRLRNYELVEVLGRGGMGVVYRAVQYSGDTPVREVALKLVRFEKWLGIEDQGSNRLISRFREESRCAAQLEHSNIVRVYDVGEMDGLDYFSMQLVTGMNLSQRVESQPLSIAQTIKIIMPIAKAVAFAHANGVVHRDLKPSNILLDQQGNPYIADFGLAKAIKSDSNLTETGQILGTPSYMSPEQAAGDTQRIGPPADIYGLGGLLYFCLTGQPPFAAATMMDTLFQVLENEPKLPRSLNSSVPYPIELICVRCLEKRPEDRYASPQEIVEDLDRFIKGLPVLAKSPTWMERIYRFGRRSPALAVHLVTIGLMLVLSQFQFAIFQSADSIYHLKVSLLLLGWMATSLLLNRIMVVKSVEAISATIWLCSDAVFLTLLIALLSDPLHPPGPLLIGYPMIVVGGGMFFRERMVLLVTSVSILSYVGLLMLEPYLVQPLFKHACFVLILACIGGCVTYTVRRVRFLNDYFDSLRTTEGS